MVKDFDTFEFAAIPSLPKQQVLELARGQWVEEHANCCLIGNAGTGTTPAVVTLADTNSLTPIRLVVMTTPNWS